MPHGPLSSAFAELASLDVAARDETDCVDLLAALEALKSAAEAAQARLAVRLDVVVRAREADQGIPATRRGRGVAGQVALARRESPHRGRVLLGLAHDLCGDLPRTLDALASGHLNEHRALLIARETGCLDRADRARIDEQICGDAAALDGLGTRRLVGRVHHAVCTTDPAAVARRARKAAGERRVTLRPAPDTMAYLTALLPVAEAVAAHAALTRDAATLATTLGPVGQDRSGGRTKSQIAADLLVERLTGQEQASAVPVTIDLIVSDATLLGAGVEPGTIPGWGPIPAQIARELVATSFDGQTPTWLRRIYTDPGGAITATTSRQRFAPTGLADHLRIRDQGLCRTPYCDAPARHVDHIRAAAAGGPTNVGNGQGLCEACNHIKQAPGWTQTVVTDPAVDGRHTVETTTPTGHRHRSTAPPSPRAARRTDPTWVSLVETAFQIRYELAV